MTGLGLNNEGHYNVKPYVEMDSMEEGASYNVKNSRLWRRLEQIYRHDISARYAELRKNGVFEVDTIIGAFKELVIDKISEDKYNFDAVIKYYIDSDTGKTSDGLQMAQGTRLQKVRRWLIERFTFCDSMFGYEPRTNNTVQFRSNAGGEAVTLHIKTYEPQYLSVKFNASANGTVTHFCNKDRFTTFVGTSGADQNQEMFIYSAHNLMEIGGISGGTNVSSLFMQNATRLRKLDVSGSTVITELRVEAMEMLQELICHSCPNLKYFINVGNCYNLKKLDAHGTATQRTPITGIQFPKGGSLISLDLSYTDVSEIRLESQPFLREIDLTGCSRLVTFSIIDCPKLESIILPQADLETFIAKKCPNLETINISAGKNLTTIELGELDGLKTLDVSRNYSISTVLNLTGCPNLQSLNADSCDTLKYIAFRKPVPYISGLPQFLDLSNCANLIGIKCFDEAIGLLTEDFFAGVDYIDMEGFDALEDISFYNCQAIKTVKNFNHVAPSSSSIFYNCSNLERFENSKLTLLGSIANLFYGCVKLTVLPAFDFTGVTSASRSFESCRLLTIAQVQSIMNSFSDKLTSQYRLFAHCTGINVTGANFPETLFNKCSKLTTLSEMFIGCTNIKCEFPERLLMPLKEATSFYHAFSSCNFTGTLKANTFSNITSGATNTKLSSLHCMFHNNNFLNYDEGIFRTLNALSNAESFLSYNDNLCSVAASVEESKRPNYIKEDLFAHNPNLTDVRSFFNSTPLYGKLWNEDGTPILLFKNNPKLIDAGYFFSGTKLTGDIPEMLFDNAPNEAIASLRIVDGFFNHCDMTGCIPENLLEKNKNLTTCANLFADNPLLEHRIIIEYDEQDNEIRRYNQPFPPKLFQNKPELADASNVFKNCTGLVGQLPFEMFKGSPKLDRVNGLFYGCTNLTDDIPEDLLAYSSSITDASYLFYGCRSMLSTLPPLLFENCSKVVSLAYAFFDCEQIRDGVPEGFLDNCVALQSTSHMFAHCNNLNILGTNHTYAIPENLFINCRELSDTSSMFTDCHNLKGTTKQLNETTFVTYGIPPNLFFANRKLRTTKSMFYGCYDLAGEIPEALFAQQTSELQDVSYMFGHCGSLSYIYETLFGAIDNTTGVYDGRLPNIFTFQETFVGCGSLRGRAPQLWHSHGQTANGTRCYDGATNLDNYSDILNSWK